jgi:DNA-binding NtrC family response regulator
MVEPENERFSSGLTAAAGVEAVSVLLVSPRARAGPMRSVFSHTRWPVVRVDNPAEGIELLRQQEFAVVVYECLHPTDGEWRSVLDSFRTLGPGRVPSRLIVTSENPESRLWADVLAEGGYDVLARPYRVEEVTRVVSLAWLHWKSERDQQAKAQAPSPAAPANRKGPSRTPASGYGQTRRLG